MYKPKVEFYNHYISSLPWPTDLNVYCSILLLNVYVPANYERYSIKIDREFSEPSFFSISSICDLDLWPTHLKM